MTSEIEIYKEKIKVFDLENNLLGFENKFKFYKSLREEFKKKGKVSRKVHTIRLFLLNGDGYLYLTRRSRLKKENSLLFDKTIGAHIRKNETPEYTVLREAEEELSFAAVSLDKDEFEETIKETNLTLFGVVKQVDTINNFTAIYKNPDGTKVVFPQITTILFGVYDGKIKFEDSETDIIELFELSELKKELKENPEKYTEDLKVLIPKYEKELKELIKLIKSSRQ